MIFHAANILSQSHKKRADTITISATATKIQTLVDYGFDLTFPDSNNANNHVGSYTDTWTAKDSANNSYNISNFNNNNWNNWSVIKAGRKSVASVATIVTGFTVDRIQNVKLTIDSVTSAKVNSIKVYIASDISFTQNVESFALTDVGTGEKTITINSSATARYVKIEFDMASGSSNGLIAISRVVINGKHYE